MGRKRLAAGLFGLLLSAELLGQAPPAIPVALANSSSPSTHNAYYLDPLPLHFDLILPLPPTRNSSVTAAELAELHRLEALRTPVQIAQAQADDHEENIFIFKSVMGSHFIAEELPVTAELSAHIRKDEAVAGGSLKNIYRRPRPYQVDNTLHPVCPVTLEPTSYPSGHSLSGYLLALTLVQLVPEKRQQIFDRVEEYVHNRLICGVHYASDIEASRKLAYSVYGSLAVSPRFQHDLAAAREETRRKLGLPLAIPTQ